MFEISETVSQVFMPVDKFK